MATITISGPIVGNEPELKTFDSGFATLRFSMLDKKSVKFTSEDQKTGQFYNCEIIGKPAVWAADRLKKGSLLSLTGDLVQYKYNDTVRFQVRNGQPTFLDKRADGEEGSSPF
jgi:single-stranded DNA-binding protein